jgi:dTMP kinase
MNKKGFFITFEGGEGSGKTTQIKKLAAYFEKQKKEIITTREPGATLIGQQIRQILLDTDHQFSSPLSELLLFTVDRLEHLASVVIPALKAGKIVLCDRFVDSTIAYQVGAQKVSYNTFNLLNKLIKIKPALTFLLDIEPEEGIQRARARAVLNRLDKKTLDFHHQVRAKYLELAAQDPERIKTINVMGLSEDQVFTKILAHIKAIGEKL